MKEPKKVKVKQKLTKADFGKFFLYFFVWLGTAFGLAFVIVAIIAGALINFGQMSVDFWALCADYYWIVFVPCLLGSVAAILGLRAYFSD